VPGAVAGRELEGCRATGAAGRGRRSGPGRRERPGRGQRGRRATGAPGTSCAGRESRRREETRRRKELADRLKRLIFGGQCSVIENKLLFSAAISAAAKNKLIFDS
jgi:hypothetical protein